MTTRRSASVVAACLGLLLVSTMDSALAFDSGIWKAQRFSQARDNPRSTMVPEARRRISPGMTRQQIVDLLGLPDNVESLAERAGRYEYDIGTAAYGVDREHLEIRFDADDKVVAHRLVRS